MVDPVLRWLLAHQLKARAVVMSTTPSDNLLLRASGCRFSVPALIRPDIEGKIAMSTLVGLEIHVGNQLGETTVSGTAAAALPSVAALG